MDILIKDNIAWELFPDGAPVSMVADHIFIFGYGGEVTAGQTWTGTEFVDTPEVITIPVSVTMRQARLALLENNLLDAVNTAMETATEADKIEWEYATSVHRDSALVVNMGIALGLTDEDLDNLFILADTK